MRLKTLLGAFIFVLAFQGIAFSTVFKWVDENGVTVFSDTPPSKNPEKAKAIEVSPVQAVAVPSVEGSSAATSNKAEFSAHKVELYVTSWCPYCKKAENFFRSQGIPFTVYDIEKDQNAARRKNQLDTRKGVPFAVVNAQKIHGFSEEAYRQALDLNR